MLYRGRELDGASLWAQYVKFPQTMPSSGFAPLVVCPNPEHGSTKRHFQVNLDQPLVHCFAHCGISGTYEHALSVVTGCTPKEAVRKILLSTTVQIGTGSKRKVRIKGKLTKPGDKPIDLSFDTYIPPAAMEYLESRGITSASIAMWGLGWDAEERRIVIPAHDERGILRFLIKRAIRPKDWPKYLYSEGFPKTNLLYGACHLDRNAVRSDGMVLVEGSVDTISIRQHDIRIVAGILGSGLSEKQAEIIARHRPPRLICMFDKDVAGLHALESVERRCPKLPIFTCLWPKGRSDPNELTNKEAWRMIDRAIPLSTFKQRLPRRLRTKERAVTR